MLVTLFNMEPRDYKRFLNFLNTHSCNLRFQQAGSEDASARTVA